MDKRLLMAAVVAGLADQHGEPMRPTALAALIGERTLTGPVVDALEYLRREGVVELASANRRVLGYRLAPDGLKLRPAARETCRAMAKYDAERGAVA